MDKLRLKEVIGGGFFERITHNFVLPAHRTSCSLAPFFSRIEIIIMLNSAFTQSPKRSFMKNGFEKSVL